MQNKRKRFRHSSRVAAMPRYQSKIEKIDKKLIPLKKKIETLERKLQEENVLMEGLVKLREAYQLVVDGILK